MDMLGLQLVADAAADREEHLREVLEWEFLADEVVEELAAKDLMQAKHPYTQGLLNCLPRIGGDRGPLPSLDRDAAWAV